MSLESVQLICAIVALIAAVVLATIPAGAGSLSSSLKKEFGLMVVCLVVVFSAVTAAAVLQPYVEEERQSSR